MVIMSMFLVTILYLIFFIIFVYLMKKQIKVDPNVDHIKIEKYTTKFEIVEIEEIKYVDVIEKKFTLRNK